MKPPAARQKNGLHVRSLAKDLKKFISDGWAERQLAYQKKKEKVKKQREASVERSRQGTQQKYKWK